MEPPMNYFNNHYVSMVRVSEECCVHVFHVCDLGIFMLTIPGIRTEEIRFSFVDIGTFHP